MSSNRLRYCFDCYYWTELKLKELDAIDAFGICTRDPDNLDIKEQFSGCPRFSRRKDSYIPTWGKDERD